LRGSRFHQDGTRGDDGALSDGDSGTDEGLGGDPDLIFDGDGRGMKLECLALPIMGTGAEKGLLRKADIRAQADRREAEDGHVVADPNMVPGRKTPGERDVDAGADDNAGSQAGAKETEQEDSKRRGPREWVEEEKAFAQDPEAFADAAGSAIEIRVVVKV